MDDFNYNHEMDNIDEILKECVEKEIVIQSDEREYKENRKKKKKPKSLLTAVIAAATAGTLAGGIIVGALGLYILPKTKMFKNTELYKSIKSEYNTGSSGTQVVSTSVSLGNDLTIPEIAKKVGPAVVGVSTKSVSEIRGYFMEPYEEESEGMGSGIIFSKDGYIVTNYHVISGAEKIKVILNSGKEYDAKVVNYNASMDMAVIKITDKVDNLPTAEFGDSDKLEVGELAVAIGNPLGRDFLGSVTAGVVSAVNRQVKIEGTTLNLIQTDAAINPGNSGGALVNSKGQVIGINTAKIGQSGVEGIGFAIPINAVKAKINELSKPLLKIGIMGIDITKELSSQYNLPIGVYIKQVQSFSPAEKAGIQAGDVIVKFAGEKIKTVEDINKIKAKYNAGDVVNIEVVRDGKTKVLSLKLDEY